MPAWHIFNNAEKENIKLQFCNGYKPNGQKRMQARTVDVPKEVRETGDSAVCHGRGRAGRKSCFRTGIDQSENTRFEDYANRWLERMAKRYNVSTLEGYRRMLEAVYPAIGRTAAVQDPALWCWEELCENCASVPDGTVSH